jgi:uncharacterized repeat protein (TIGR04138 family)
MIDPAHPMAKLLQDDRRYKFDAYVLVLEALGYAHKVLGLGQVAPGESEEEETDDEQRPPERHLTGQQLCEAIRLYALEQYGFMAQSVLKSWGLTRTGDFGEIVYNLIGIGHMRKTSEDRREHFDDVFDFDQGFRDSFQIHLPESLKSGAAD